MQARTLPEYVRITNFQEIDGEWIAETDCNSYQEYRALPAALEVKGIRLCKAGWSSDRYICCYKQKGLLGTIIDTYV